MNEAQKKAEAEIEKFHAHLDVCKQCRDHPFDLCPVGAPLLMAAGNAAAQSIALPVLK